MSSKNFMAYGDAESVLTGFANSINANKKNLGDISYEYYIRNGLKNLAVINQESSIMNTIAFTNNGDGTWTVNGTNSKSSSAYCFPMIVGPGYFKPGRYTLTGIPSGAENISLTLRYNGGSGNTSIATINGSTPSVTFNLTAAQVAAATLNFNLMIGVPASATVNNVTVSPMIVYEEVGSISSTFEKAGKTNKDLENEKVSWSDAYTSVKKNLLKNTASTTTKNGGTFTVNSDGSITISTDANGFTSDTTIRLYRGSLPKGSFLCNGLPNGGAITYKLQIAPTSGGDAVNIFGDDVPFTNNSDDSWDVNLTVYSGQVFTTPVTIYPMIRLASIADSTYAPYIPDNAELKALVDKVVWLELTGTLTAGQTTITFSNDAITANSTIDVYTDADVEYVSITPGTGSFIVEFEEQSSNLGVKVRVW